MRVKDFIYDLNHAQRNMIDCLFFQGERLIYVREVRSLNQGYLLNSFYLDEAPNEIQSIPLDENILVKAFPLGYVNIPEEKAVISVSRSTSRLYKYGLSAEHLDIEVNPVEWSRTKLLTSIHLARTIMQQFSTIQEAQELGGCAFHNYYFVRDNTIDWFYWEEPIGVVKNGEIELQRPFAFLKEELTEITGMLTVSC